MYMTVLVSDWRRFGFLDASWFCNAGNRSCESKEYR